MNYLDTMVTLLRNIGLNQYEARAYATLLLSGSLSAGELSQKANLPRPRVYDIVNSLIKKGFVMMQPGRPVRYKAIPPSEAIESYINMKKEQFEREVEKIRDVSKQLKDIYDRVGEKSEEGGIWIINNDSMLKNKVQSLIQSADREVVIAASSDFILDNYSYILPHIEDALNRGVKVKLVIPKNVSTAIALPEGVELVETDYDVTPAVVVDSKKAFMGIPRDNKGVLFEHSDFSRTFKRMLDSIL